MKDFERWLAEGDLKSDGRANEVVDIVLESPMVIEYLIASLQSENPVVRGHAADAIEKIGREKPEIYLPYTHRLIKAAEEDPVDMVQWHLAMLFGHLVLFEEYVDLLLAALIEQLNKGGAFTKTWAMTSLCIIARLYPAYQARIVGEISKYKGPDMPSVRNRAEKSLKIILEGEALPENWVKSPAIQAQLQESTRE